MRTRRQLILLVLKNSLMNQQARTAATLPAPPTPSSLFFFSSSRRPTTIQYTRSRSYSSNITMSGSGSGSANPDLDSLFQQKRILRTKVKKDLKSMPSSQKSQEDTAIQNLVLESSWFKSSKRLCAYISCTPLREVETSQILEQILSHPPKDQDNHTEIEKKLYVPRVEDKNCHMRMFNISSIHDLIANSMNILEPAPEDSDGNQREDVMQASDPVDLFLLPGLAFDKSGRRLGRGGGYYDTFLLKYQALASERQWKQPLLVALSYSRQILDEGIIPMTPHDVLVDALVTSSGVIPISKTALERM
ncbi:hypothetical protein C5167_036108 [Papaver somniferum]|uniref:5-formyltetrahydrofolate cyclo-ligase, mitochondrial-like n=1 Tax=Papaver somniferum TaxID=3469 RepID=UPI000E6FB62D|nr:5-formyltetrahydrofolate cyclo-ligase, mitochondrial-like [Papaver somniferum]RZC87569.1 hypothetical protein C5167_036108 [Papaver somniferum]